MSPVLSCETADFENSCGSSHCRYDYYYKKRLQDKNLQTTSPSIGWGLEAVKACRRITSKKQTARISIPVLIFQAGAETVVRKDSQSLFAMQIPGCRLQLIPDRKHELYMTDSDVLIPYWESIFRFFQT